MHAAPIGRSMSKARREKTESGNGRRKSAGRDNIASDGVPRRSKENDRNG